MNKNDLNNLLKNNVVLVFKIRNSRIKVKKVAIMEVYSLLKDLGSTFLSNGPLGDIKGIFSFMINEKKLEESKLALSKLGYTNKVYLLNFNNESMVNETDLKSINELIWKKKKFSIYNFLEIDEEIFKNSQVHNRVFYIYDENHNVKKIKGYRGDGTDTGKRALPVEDARLMLNISMIKENDTVLDPFAGAGGIVYEARNYYKKLNIISADIDEIISPGLQRISDKHIISDIRDLYFKNESVDRIVTEVPFSINSINHILIGLINLKFILKENGSLVLMVSDKQKETIEDKLKELKMNKYFESNINRKGTDVWILAYSKSYFEKDYLFYKSLDLIY